jgi:hypothetical protein
MVKEEVLTGIKRSTELNKIENKTMIFVVCNIPK